MIPSDIGALLKRTTKIVTSTLDWTSGVVRPDRHVMELHWCDTWDIQGAPVQHRLLVELATNETMPDDMAALMQYDDLLAVVPIDSLL